MMKQNRHREKWGKGKKARKGYNRLLQIFCLLMSVAGRKAPDSNPLWQTLTDAGWRRNRQENSVALQALPTEEPVN